MKKEEALRKLGLAGNEVKVYLTLLRLGLASASEITKNSGVNRTNVYDALDKLISKGLVGSIIKLNKKHFEAVNPERILEILDDQKQKLKKRYNIVKNMLPELSSLYKLSKNKQEVTLFTGKEGLKSLWSDVFKIRKPVFLFSTGKFKKIFKLRYLQTHKKRVSLGIKIKILYSENLRIEERENELELAEIKYLPEEFENPAAVIVYGDRIAMVVWSEQPITILIKSREITKSYLNYFKFLWKIARN